MKRSLIAALVLGMLSSTALAQRARLAPKTEPVRTAPSAKTTAEAPAKASKTDAALTANLEALAQGKQLTAAEAKLTCNGKDGLVPLVRKTFKSYTDRLKFDNALKAINAGGAVVQSCQAGEPITNEDSLKNLGEMVVEVGALIETNQGKALDKNTWAQALAKVLKIDQADALARVEKLAGEPCNLLKLN
ncbi:MAG: hypothetical protein CL676_07835 [Bdellovibrionaceae bacterium]|nr:hypothetical protein [Pseudobdellovibrionaceae bacterium]|tara:strand:- start:137 stop:706 length:570 start_codon:yes stop_codon:yes gene_type:complete